MIKIKFIKDTEKFKVGDVAEASKKSAKSAVSQGYAEYVGEPKLNYNQKKTIEDKTKITKEEMKDKEEITNKIK